MVHGLYFGKTYCSYYGLIKAYATFNLTNEKAMRDNVLLYILESHTHTADKHRDWPLKPFPVYNK